ncbi:MAG: hypothetical protein GC190_22030 [Alphaproteobacteria bacterium]|nr:hypothetical protein [Alphaproteobacteria bacterium]
MRKQLLLTLSAAGAMLLAIALAIAVLAGSIYAAAYYPTLIGVVALLIIGVFVIGVVTLIARS